MNKLYQVQNCRFLYDHTTKGHKCGICHKFGHGQIEHYNQELKNNLNNFIMKHYHKNYNVLFLIVIFQNIIPQILINVEHVVNLDTLSTNVSYNIMI
jgi:hypothetical protein